MMNRASLIALLLAASSPAFRYQRDVHLAPNAAPETCVVLPADLLSHAAPQLQDLRVRANDHDVAYQLRVSGTSAVEETRPQTILNLGERNAAVSFDVEMTEPRYSRVLLRLGRSHFSVLIHISGMERMGESAVSFPEIAYSSNGDGDETQQRLISLPESSFRYLHFEVQTLALEPLTPQDIAGVDVLMPKPEPPRFLQAASASPPEQKPHATVVEFSVAANVPVERLTFASDDPNAIFSRTADVERYRSEPPPDEAQRSQVPVQSEGIVFAHASDTNRPAEDSTVNLALGAVPYTSIVRLTIQNGDDAPLALHALTLQMRERQACFLRKANVSYELLYGDPALGPPQYDLSPLEAASAEASVSTLGPERALNPLAGASLRPFTERHPVLLWLALILVVGTLGFVALRSARNERP